jgi:hypothetical protein
MMALKWETNGSASRAQSGNWMLFVLGNEWGVVKGLTPDEHGKRMSASGATEATLDDHHQRAREAAEEAWKRLTQ